MGKNKVKSGIFKVAGSRGFKAKCKAKAVNLNLKNIVSNCTAKSKQSRVSVDKQLTEVEHLVNKQSSGETTAPPKPEIVISQPPISIDEEIATLDQLHGLQCK